MARQCTHRLLRRAIFGTKAYACLANTSTIRPLENARWMWSTHLFLKLDGLLALIVFPPTTVTNELDPSLMFLVQIFHQPFASTRECSPP